MIFATLAFIVGLVYGYAKPGKENRWDLLKTGAMYGLILGVIFGIIGFVGITFFMPSHTAGGVLVRGLVLFTAGTIGIFLNVIVLTIIFIAGTFIGDLLEGVLKK